MVDQDGFCTECGAAVSSKDWKEVGKPAGPEPVGPNCI